MKREYETEKSGIGNHSPRKYGGCASSHRQRRKSGRIEYTDNDFTR